VRGLEKIFSPVVVYAMSDTEVEAITSEPLSAKRQRELLENGIKKLQDGHKIFRGWEHWIDDNARVSQKVFISVRIRIPYGRAVASVLIGLSADFQCSRQKESNVCLQGR